MNFLNCRFDPDQRKLVGEGWQHTLVADQVASLKASANGKSLIFGVRPEDVDLAPSGGEGWLPGEVYVTEPLGDRTIVDMQLGGSTVKVKMDAEFEAQSGDALHMRFDPNRFHVFDEATGQALV
jgi:multiple sugar transport system ATP-binding protein